MSVDILPFKEICFIKKFKVVECIYSKGVEHGIQVDQAFYGSNYPPYFAT